MEMIFSFSYTVIVSFGAARAIPNANYTRGEVLSLNFLSSFLATGCKGQFQKSISCLTLRKQLQIFEYMPKWQIDIITELHFFLCFSHVV